MLHWGKVTFLRPEPILHPILKIITFIVKRDIYGTCGKFTRQHYHGFDAVAMYYTFSHPKQNKLLLGSMPQVVSMLVSVCRSWFSRQKISYYMAICATISLLALVVDNDIGPKGGHVITYLYASVRMRKRGIR